MKIACPRCGCPDQHVGLHCGFCDQVVPAAVDMISADGTARVEEVIGYRAWSIIGEGADMRLDSPLFHMPWTPGEWMVAVCHNQRGNKTHTPESDDPKFWPPVKGCGHPGHGCGFYAGRTREHLIQLGYGRYHEHQRTVIGQVQMQGKIIPATNGWRAQMVRPRRIYVPYELWELARDLKAVYGPHGVEVEIATTIILPKTGTDAIEWCHKCKAKMKRGKTRCEFCHYQHQ